MKRKIIFIVLCVLFVVFGIVETDNLTYLSILIKPFDLLGDFLRVLSLNSGFGNIIAILVFIIIVISPIVLLIYRVKNKEVSSVEYLFLIGISLVLGYTLYVFINPHVLIEMCNPIISENADIGFIKDMEVILKSGIAYILYSVILIYYLTRTYIYKQFDNIRISKILLDTVIILTAFAVLSIALSETIASVKNTAVNYEVFIQVISFGFKLIVSFLLIYLVNMFREFIVKLIENGFEESLVLILEKLHKYSFVLLVFSLSTQVIENIYQLIFLKKLLNVQFTFDIPLFTILITSFIYLLSKYIKKANEIKNENELFI